MTMQKGYIRPIQCMELGRQSVVWNSIVHVNVRFFSIISGHLHLYSQFATESHHVTGSGVVLGRVL